MINRQDILRIAKEVLHTEAEQVFKKAEGIDDEFINVVREITACKGKFVISGMGKSGLIGKKISATLSSYGTPSFFLHPAEAYHGDLGMIGKHDLICLISYSGETDEILKLIPFFQEMGNKIISMTGNIKSSLARNSDYCIDVSIDKEACPLQLAPTTSTTVALAMGDALAVSVMKANGVQEEHFARFHPGGSLGRKLLLKVSDQMIPKNRVPVLFHNTTAIDVLHAITDGRLGMAIVEHSSGKLSGIITDGDIRRITLREQENFIHLTASEMMTKNPKVISPEIKVFDAEKIMDQMGIHQLIVVNADGSFAGILPYRSELKEKNTLV